LSFCCHRQGTVARTVGLIDRVRVAPVWRLGSGQIAALSSLNAAATRGCSRSPTRTSRDRDRPPDQTELTLKSEAPHLFGHQATKVLNRHRRYVQCSPPQAASTFAQDKQSCARPPRSRTDHRKPTTANQPPQTDHREPTTANREVSSTPGKPPETCCEVPRPNTKPRHVQVIDKRQNRETLRTCRHCSIDASCPHSNGAPFAARPACIPILFSPSQIAGSFAFMLSTHSLRTASETKLSSNQRECSVKVNNHAPTVT
jgi:hypothetical protein